MRITDEYKGVMFSIPPNNDGVWHYRIHPKRDKLLAMRGMPQAAPSVGYCTRDAAITAAKKAIDAWLARPSG
jgi:hypothetical protein